MRSPKDNIDYSLYGSIHGVNINSPNQLNYELIGSIPGINSNNVKSKSVDKNSNYYLKGIIPSFKRKKNNNINIIQSGMESKIKDDNNNIFNDKTNNIKKIEQNISTINNANASKNDNDNENAFSNNFGSGIFSEGEIGSKIVSQRGASRKKNKGLPLVGNKKRKFILSKIKNVGDLDVDGVNYNCVKSTNVGVNGVKIGDRIIE